MLTQEELRAWYGWAEITPQEPVVAGELGRWQVIYHAGRYGIAAGGGLKLLFPTACDWPALQGKDPYEENFLTVTTDGQARLTWRYDARGHAQPYARAVLVDVAQAGLTAGERVVFYLGDPEGGSPGVRAPTAAMAHCTLRVIVDAFAAGDYVLVPSPSLKIIGGKPAQMVLLAPGQALAGAPLTLTLRIQDRWGNLAGHYQGTVFVAGGDGQQSIRFDERDGGLRRVPMRAPGAPGIYRYVAREEALGLTAESNPFRVPGERSSWQPLWGDLGVHNAPDDTTGADCYTRGREAAALDFCAITPDGTHLTPAIWQALQEAASRNDQPGQYVALLGYEWPGNTSGGGLRRVLFAGAGGTLLRCRGSEGPCYPLPALYDALRDSEALLIIASGLPAANLTFADSRLETLLEVCSARGQVPWLLQDALRQGRVLGFVGASTDPLGRPGVACAGAGELVSPSGLTCVWAEEHSRTALWEALQARRCYATSGARILLEFHGDGRPMGSVYRAERPPHFTVHVAGTEEIERVDIFRGLEIAYSYPNRTRVRPGWLRVRWGGALARDWPRQVPWDGLLRLHSARLEQVQPFGFHSPARGVYLVQEQAVSWRSTTAGNENGLLLRVAAEPGAHLEFHAPLGSLKASLDELPVARDFPGEGLHVQIEALPQGTGQRDLAFSWKETALRPGITAYWVRVLQFDGEQAWSSPIYVSPLP